MNSRKSLRGKGISIPSEAEPVTDMVPLRAFTLPRLKWLRVLDGSEAGGKEASNRWRTGQK